MWFGQHFGNLKKAANNKYSYLSVETLLSLPELCTLDKDPFSLVFINPLLFWRWGSTDFEDILEVLFGTSGGTFPRDKLFLDLMYPLEVPGAVQELPLDVTCVEVSNLFSAGE